MNWARAKSSPSACAKDRAASVLPSPGKSSSSTCPLARIGRQHQRQRLALADDGPLHLVEHGVAQLAGPAHGSSLRSQLLDPSQASVDLGPGEPSWRSVQDGGQVGAEQLGGARVVASQAVPLPSRTSRARRAGRAAPARGCVRSGGSSMSRRYCATAAVPSRLGRSSAADLDGPGRPSRRARRRSARRRRRPRPRAGPGGRASGSNSSREEHDVQRDGRAAPAPPSRHQNPRRLTAPLAARRSAARRGWRRAPPAPRPGRPRRCAWSEKRASR